MYHKCHEQGPICKQVSVQIDRVKVKIFVGQSDIVGSVHTAE